MANKKGKIPSVVNNNLSLEGSRLGNEAGALIFQTNISKDPYSAIANDTSFIQLQDKWGSYMNMMGGKLLFRSPSEMSHYVGHNYFQFVGGDAQYHYAGNKHEYIQGHHHVQTGRQGDKEIETATKLNKLADEISDAAIKAMEAASGQGDRVACDVCTVTVPVDRASRMGEQTFTYVRKIFKIMPNSPMGNIVEKIQKFWSTVAAYFLDEMSAASMNGGSCKSSGCKNNTVASPMYPIQKGNEAAAEKFKTYQKDIQNLEKLLSKDSKIETIPNTVHVKVGLGGMRDCETIALVDPIPMVTELEDGTPKWGFIPSSRGTCKRAIYNPPTITDGIDTREVTGMYYRKVGAGGIAFNTNGKVDITGSTVVIGSSKGELLLNSPNATIIGGANITLDTKGHQNGDAIKLDSDRVYIAGKLSVQGDLALKGSLMMDGGIYTPHITCPGERIETDVSSSAHTVHSIGYWNNTIKRSATKMDLMDKIGKALRNIGASLTGLVFTPCFLKTIVEETYSSVLVEAPLDNCGAPTGFAVVMDNETWKPLDIYGTCSYGGTLIGGGVSAVIPARIPIYNFPHIHGSPGDPHVHSYTTIKSIMHGNAAASIASRQPASVIPTPPLATGMGTSPGHKTAGNLGPCGGGGGPFGNANRQNSAILRRNEEYGVDGLDAFNGNDFVTSKVRYTEDGGLIPSPNFNIANCD